MAKVRLQDATLIAEQDKAPVCLSCTDMADEGEKFCANCKSYWDDVDNGLFDEISGDWDNGWIL